MRSTPLAPNNEGVRVVASLLLLAVAACAEAPPRFLGTRGCRDCHSTATVGDQVGAWKRSAHARAFESLTTEAARRVAAPLGVDDPSTDARCTKCHVTAWDVPATRKVYGFRARDGVSCESCHGPGERYAPREVMTDREEAKRQGLELPSKEACLRCHNAESPTFKGFDYEKALAAIAHPVPKQVEWDKAIAWEADYDAGLSRARREDRPVLVDFHPGIGCPRCSEMKSVYEDPDLVRAAQGFVCVRVEAPTKAQLLAHGLSDCATRIVLPDGRIAKDLYGAVPPALLTHVLLRIAQWKKGFALDPADPQSAQAKEVWGMLASQGGSVMEFIAREFVKIGRPCEPILLAEIWNPDSPYRNACLQILGHVEASERRAGRMPDPAPGVDPMWDLLAFLYDPNGDLRLIAVEGLGRIGDPRAGVPLARYATNDIDVRVITEAFRALAAVKDPASLPWLLQRAFEPHCSDPRCPIPIDALVAIGSVGDPAATDGLLAGLAERPDLAPAVLGALADVKSPKAVETALRILADRGQSFAARNEAVFTVARSGDAKGWEGLLPFLSDPNVEIRGGICEATGEMRMVLGIDPMLRAIREDPSEVVRAYAAWAIGRCFGGLPARDAEIVATLEGLLVDASPLVRVQATRALVGTGRDDLAFLLRDALRDHETWNTEDRKALTLAAETLAERKDPAAVPLLVAILDERDLDTTRVAAACLERITGEAQGHAGEVPLELSRTIFAGAGSEAVRIERKRILDIVRMIIPKWQKWLAGQPAVAPVPDDLEAAIFAKGLGGGPARESHRWLRLKCAAQAMRVIARAGDAAEPSIDRIVLVGALPEAKHDDGWEGRDLPSPHRAEGAVWLRLSGEVRIGDAPVTPVHLRVATEAWTAERDAGK